MTRHVYIISSIRDGLHCAPIKIGVANNPKSRLQTLQTGSAICLALTFSFPIKWTDAEIIERMAHEKLEPRRIRGEWFDVLPDEASYWIASIIFEVAHGQNPYVEVCEESGAFDGLDLASIKIAPMEKWDYEKAMAA